MKPLQITWRTTAFSRIILRWGSNRKYQDLWFTCGLYVTLALAPLAIALLIFAVAQVTVTPSSSTENYIMEPIIPGVNLPASEMGYYSATLVVCSVIHELGHALASVKEDVHIINVGLNVFFVVPIAFVSLNSDDLQKVGPWKSLKIFCAGVWHNVVLSLLAYLVYLCLPFVLSVLFATGKGVTVTEMTEYSPLIGANGLFVDDKVTAINDCTVTDESTWNECLNAARAKRPGFCVWGTTVNSLDESIVVRRNRNGELECCDPGKESNVCFEYVGGDDGVLEIPPHVCLPVRPVVRHTRTFCEDSGHCERNFYCLRPILHNNTNMFKVSCAGKDVIYIGYAGDIQQTVRVSSYISKYHSVSTLVPDVIEKFLKYLVTFSLGLAFVNVIPCVAMDGYFMLNSLLQIWCGRSFHTNATYFSVSLIVPLCGTLMLVILIICTLWSYLK